MTREEASFILANIDRRVCDDELNDALDMAIEALKEQYLEGYWRQIGYDIYECTVCSQNVMTGDICAYRHCHCCGTRMESEG